MIDDIKFMKLILNDKILNILFEFDKDNQKINFPKDNPNKNEVMERIRKEYDEEPEGMFLLLYKDEVIGALFLKTMHNPYRECFFGNLRCIYLKEEFRCKHIGEKLMLFMEEYFKKRNCKYIYLGTSFYNESSKKLFKKMGYKETRIIMEKEI